MIHLQPSFFIIGERKCGTSSLYRYLLHHPYILPCALKEPNFFGKGKQYIAQHLEEYWQLFPTKKGQAACTFMWPELNQQGILYEEAVTIPRVANRPYITGEASANTFQEVEPLLLKQYLPNIKLIVLVRHPVERAFSHHRMYQRFQEEGRKLGFVVNDFKQDMLVEIEAIQKGGQGPYLSPSMYDKTLNNWIHTFGADAIRLYFTEDLNSPDGAITILKDLELFLQIPTFDFGNFLNKRFNKAPSARVDPSIRNRLSDFFAPYNEALFSIANTYLSKQYSHYQLPEKSIWK